MSTKPNSSPPVAPKPKPKPRSAKPKEGDKHELAEGNGSTTQAQSLGNPVPQVRPRLGTYLPGMADSGYLEPTSRPRVATNPVQSRDKSPSQHRRTTSDVKNDENKEPIYDTPWGKRLRPSVPPPGMKKASSPTPSGPFERKSVSETASASQRSSSTTPFSPTPPPASQGFRSPVSSPTPPPVSTNVRSQSFSSSSVEEDSTPLSPKRQAPLPPSTLSQDGNEPVPRSRPTPPPSKYPPTVTSPTQKPNERATTPDVVHGLTRGTRPSSSKTQSTGDVQKTLSAERVAEDMDFFNIELRKVATSAMIGVSVQVKPLSTKPEVKRIVRAPFVSKVLPMGAVDKDGRIQAGDAIVEVNGKSLLQMNQEEATHCVNDTPGKTVKLKVGRPLGPVSTMRAPLPAAVSDSTKVRVDGDRQQTTPPDDYDATLSRVEELLLEKQQLEEERSEAKSELEKVKEQMKTTISENEKTTAATLAKAAEAQEKLNQELVDLQEQMKELLEQRQDQDTLLTKLEKKNGEVSSLTLEVSRLQELLKEHHSKEGETTDKEDVVSNEAGPDDKETQEVADLRQQVDRLRADLTTRDNQLEEKERKIGELKKGLTEALPKLQDAERAIAGYKVDLLEKDKRIEELAEKVRKLEETRSVAVEEEPGAEDTQDKETEEKVSKYSPRKPKPQAVIDLEAQVEKLQTDLEEANQRASEAEKKLAEKSTVEHTVIFDDHSTSDDDSHDIKLDVEEVGSSQPDDKDGNLEEEKDEMTTSTKSQEVTGSESPVPKPRTITPKPDKEEQDGDDKETKPPPKPMPRPRKKPDASATERPKSHADISEKEEGHFEKRSGSMSNVIENDWVMVNHEDKEPTPNFDDFDNISTQATVVRVDANKDKMRVGRRTRKSPSREHLHKMSLGDIGDELAPVKLTVISEDALVEPGRPLNLLSRHSRNLSGSHNMGPPQVLPKPKPMSRTKSAENLADSDNTEPSLTPTNPQMQRIPVGARVMLPGLSNVLKKAQSDNSLDVDDIPLNVHEEDVDGRASSGSSPSKSRPGSAKGPQRGLGVSTESLDKLDDDGVDLGIPLLTVPDWSVDLVAQWMDGVKLGKYSSAVKEKKFTGKQLLECESGKLKNLQMTKEDISILKKEVKHLKRLHEKAKKEDKKRIDAERKEAKKKKK